MIETSELDSYAIEVRPLPADLGGGFEAFFPQFARGVVGYGATQQEAVEDLLAAAPGFLEAVEEMGQELPSPPASKEWEEFSGKFNVRVARMLHAKLVRLAEEQSVSLNSLVQTILMSGATALEAGLEFGAVVERDARATAQPGFLWQNEPLRGMPALRLEDYSAFLNERNPDEWKMAAGE